VAQQLANIMTNTMLMLMPMIRMTRMQPMMLTIPTTLMAQTMGLTKVQNSSRFR
jgi:hypothetical protein